MDSSKSYYFYTKEDAVDALDKIKSLVKQYKIISKGDVNEICGFSSAYTDISVGWNEAMIERASILRSRDKWSIVLPRALPLEEFDKPKISYCEYTPPKTTTPEPLCITIHTNEVDDIDAAFAETFKYIYTIKDRMINLTIM